MRFENNSFQSRIFCLVNKQNGKKKAYVCEGGVGRYVLLTDKDSVLVFQHAVVQSYTGTDSTCTRARAHTHTSVIIVN